MIHSASDTETDNSINSKRGAIGTALIMSAVLGLPLFLSSCGFHLRGYQTPMNYTVQSTALIIKDDPTSFRLKLPLKQRMNAVGVDVVDEIGREINSSQQIYTSSIRIDNVQLKRYELVGVLTEVRLVLSADVVYETLNNEDGIPNDPISVKNKVQVERTYQYDEASVSIEDEQGKQVQDWLYQNLAQRITDQYVALNLPRKTTVATDTDDPNVSILLPNDTDKTSSKPDQ